VPLPVMPRLVVSNVDNLEEKAFPSLDNVFHNGNGTFVPGKVASIEKKTEKFGGSVVLEDGQRIPFDVLVLASGSTWTGPIALPEGEAQVKEFIRNSRDEFEKAQSIVIAGGGAVGLELTGEIRDIWPRKQITIVQGGSALLNEAYPEKYRRRVETGVRARGARIVLDDYIDTFEVGPISNGTGVKTRKGVEIQADLVISARGPTPNTGFIESSLGSQAVTSRKNVRVRPTLQLQEHADIFALGDIIDWKEQKQIMKAWAHAGIVAANVDAYLSGGKLKPYKGSTETIMITNGKNGGASFIGMLWGFVFGNWFTSTVKSKGLFLSGLRASVGQQ